MQHVVVATDLSPASDAAVERAAAVSRALSAELRLLHVLPEILPPLLADRRQQQAERALRYRAQGVERRAGVRASCNVVRGDTPRGIVRESENLEAVLTVFGRRRQITPKRRVVATTPERSLRLIRNAALVVRDQSGRQNGYRKALLAPETDIEADSMIPYLHHLAPSAAMHRIELRGPAGERRPQRRTVEHVRAMRQALDADLLVIGVPRDETLNPFRFRRLLSPLIRLPECDTLVVPQGCTPLPADEAPQARIRIAS